MMDHLFHEDFEAFNKDSRFLKLNVREEMENFHMSKSRLVQ